jgi:hydroxymethylpyrimidine/phosphomethylpyrimidine kinase
MTIAGSDSGGGAGIQADLKTFAVMGVHGTSAITSITAQNTREVRAIHDLPPEMVAAQIEAVADDLGVDAAKTGMLSNAAIIEAVAKTVDRYGFPLVVDPVMVAKSGARLLREDAVEAMRRLMVPRATVVTPNAPEAEVLTGVKVRDRRSQEEAARIIVEELGAEAAVVKGGHLGGGESVDILYYKGRVEVLRAPRVSRNTTHGTGCAFSAAIAAGLAKGRSVPEAVRVAKEFITMAIDYGLEIGGGVGPVNPVAWMEVPAERWRVLANLEEALAVLREREELAVKLIPEVQTNIAMALPAHYSRTPLDVAGFPGRIGVSGGRLVVKAKPEFGASRHMARLVLTALRYDPERRAAMNIRFHPALVEAAESLGLLVAEFRREEEPREVREREGASLPWALERAVQEHGRVPDVLYDRGAHGKEPMIRIIARSAVEAARTALRIAEKAGL